MRNKRFLGAIAALGLAVVLSGCASQQASDARPVSTAQDQSEARRSENAQREPDLANPEPKESDDLGSPSNPKPDHMGMEPPYEPQPLWPASGTPEFPSSLPNGFTGGTDIDDLGMFMTTLYSDNDYNLVSVRLSDTFLNYNAREHLNEDFRYVDDVLCAGSVSSTDGEIMSRTCWLLGTDGTLWASSYSEAVTYNDLAEYLQTVYDHLAENAREQQ